MQRKSYMVHTTSWCYQVNQCAHNDIYFLQIIITIHLLSVKRHSNCTEYSATLDFAKISKAAIFNFWVCKFSVSFYFLIITHDLDTYTISVVTCNLHFKLNFIEKQHYWKHKYNIFLSIMMQSSTLDWNNNKIILYTNTIQLHISLLCL